MPITPTSGRRAGPSPQGVRSRCASPGPRLISWRSIATVAATAALCATIAWVFVGPVTGTDLTVHDGLGTREVGVLSVIVSTVLIALVAGALLRWWQRRSAAGTRRWTLLALAVAVVSLLGPTSADTFQAGMALVSLHTVVAAVVIVGLARSRRC